MVSKQINTMLIDKQTKYGNFHKKSTNTLISGCKDLSYWSIDIRNAPIKSDLTSRNDHMTKISQLTLNTKQYHRFIYKNCTVIYQGL